MTISLMEGVERWLNTFPILKEDESTLSPVMVLEGRNYTMHIVTHYLFFLGVKNNHSHSKKIVKYIIRGGSAL